MMNTVFKNSKVSQFEEYLPSDFEYRLLSIQNILKEEGVDGLLVINGADGDRNPESSKLINYLLKGSFGHHISAATFTDFDYEEAMLMITQTTLSIFIEARGHAKLKELLLGLHNPYIFVPQGDILDNQDLLENLKIREFYRFVYDKPTIGVLLPIPEKGEKNIMQVEQWPIVRAYALDGVGSGFLTLRHKCIDLSARLDALYTTFDFYQQRIMINQVSKRLINNNELLMKEVSDFRLKNKSSDLDQKDLSSLFVETFEIGEMARTTPLPSPKPRLGIYFGVNSADGGNEKTKIREAGPVPGYQALHFLVENVILSNLG
jgi:hypothetical protein